MEKSQKKDKRKRDYEPHEFPVLVRKEGDPLNDQLRLALYKETCQSWRTLLNIRFKLLAIDKRLRGLTDAEIDVRVKIVDYDKLTDLITGGDKSVI